MAGSSIAFNPRIPPARQVDSSVRPRMNAIALFKAVVVAAGVLGLALLSPQQASAQSPSLAFVPDPAGIHPQLLFQSGVRSQVGSTRTDAVLVRPADFAAGTTGTVQNCAITGTGAAAFGSVSGVDLSVSGTSGTQSIPLSCTSAQTNQQATLSCSTSVAGQTRTRNWPLTCPACALRFTGNVVTGALPTSVQDVEISAGTMSRRLDRQPPASTCANPSTVPAINPTPGPRRFHRFRIASRRDFDQCVTLQLRSDGATHFMVAYSSFDPNNLQSNFLGDPGTSTVADAPAQMSVTLRANTSMDVVVHEVNPESASTNYTFSMDACTRFPFFPPRHVVVENLNDSGVGSLRQALAQTELAPNSTISFAPGLSGQLLLLSPIRLGSDVQLIGPGADRLELRRFSGTVPVLEVASGVVASVSGVAIAQGQSGGLVNSGTLLAEGVHVRGNAGGGIINRAGGVMRVRGSAITSNVGALGPALLNSGTIEVVNTTIASNGVTIVGSPGTLVNEGAGAEMMLYNTTIAGNINVTPGAANFAIDNRAGARLVLINTVLANTSAQGQIRNQGTLSAATSVSLDGSLSAGNGNQINTDPRLSQLADHGGTTPTFLPAGNSPLRNSGSEVVLAPLYGEPPFVDQRGLPRVQESAVDIGAVETSEVLLADGFE